MQNMPIRYVAVVAGRDTGAWVSQLTKFLSSAGIKSSLVNLNDIGDLREVDAVILVGADSDVLKAIHAMGSNVVPLLPISPPGFSTFFASIDWEEVGEGIKRLVSGRYVVRDYVRIRALIDGSEIMYALNEVAVFPTRSATLVDYDLVIDGELVWRDTADGVLVATPAGSTAYAFSAGGPIIMTTSKVLEVVPVNSVNPLRRAIVVHDSAVITITNINSRSGVEVVADGVRRVKVSEGVKVVKAEAPARFIRFEGGLGDVIERKARVVTEPKNLPPSAKYVLKMLRIYGQASPKELVELTGLPERTVRYALSVLLKRGLVRRVTDLRDSRRRIYKVA